MHSFKLYWAKFIPGITPMEFKYGMNLVPSLQITVQDWKQEKNKTFLYQIWHWTPQETSRFLKAIL